MNNKKDNIVLIGMPGSGKSTIGVQLAKWLGYKFIDTDLLIQSEYNDKLGNIVKKFGDIEFLKIENDLIKNLEIERSVIATGGSVVYGEDAMMNLKSSGLVIYLETSLEELESRLGDLEQRGVVSNGKKAVREILEDRKLLYEKYADITLNMNEKTPVAAADKVYKVCCDYLKSI